MFDEGEVVRAHKYRADAIFNIVILCFGVILARLWYLQIYKGDVFFKYSQENRLRKENVSAPRGMIFSRNNDLLVHNVPSFDVVITPQYLKNKKDTLKKLSEIISVPVPAIEKIMRKYSTLARYKAITIKRNASRKEVAIIETEAKKIPGVSVKSFIGREYTDKEVGSHLLGYISEISQEQLPRYKKRDKLNYKLGDYIGQAGIEYKFDSSLRGVDGHEYMEVDAFGRMKRHVDQDGLFAGLENTPATAGYNIRLTIDRDIQLAAYKALEDKDIVGSAVAVDVNTGEILAMVSRPSYDPSQFSRGLSSDYWRELSTNPLNPMRDRAIQDHYMPGSTFKTFTAIAALEEGIVDADTEINCPGYFRLGRRKFHCWKRYGHGNINVHRALKESCDVFFYKVGTKLDIDVLAKYAKLFGFGAYSGISLPRETQGLIPTKDWKLKRTGEPWQKGETLSCVIGQGFILTTNLQLAMAYSAVANGGQLFRPHLVKEIFANDGTVIKKFDRETVHEVKISPDTLKIVNDALRDVVNVRGGTAWWYRGSGIEMAGKTGTSQVARFSADKIFNKCSEFPYKLRHHGLFVAYAPARNPKIAISIVAEHGCHGSTMGGPVARAVITKYMKKYHPELRAEIIKDERKQKHE